MRQKVFISAHIPICISKKLFYFKETEYNSSREFSDRVKSEICKPCKYFKKCNGVLKVYIDTY